MLFNASTWKAKEVDCEFDSSLVYTASSWSVIAYPKQTNKQKIMSRHGETPQR